MAIEKVSALVLDRISQRDDIGISETEIDAELEKYAAAKEVIWCQEEPMNQGAWFQIRHHLQACVSSRHSLHYAGRARSPAPATGHLKTHAAEHAALVEQALVAPIGTDSSAE